jgi:hypothetical protein
MARFKMAGGGAGDFDQLEGTPPSSVTVTILGDGSFDPTNGVDPEPDHFDCADNEVPRVWLRSDEPLSNLIGSYTLDQINPSFYASSATGTKTFCGGTPCEQEMEYFRNLGESPWPIPNGGTLESAFELQTWSYSGFDHLLFRMGLTLTPAAQFLPNGLAIPSPSGCWEVDIILTDAVGITARVDYYNKASGVTTCDCLLGYTDGTGVISFHGTLCCPHTWEDFQDMTLPFVGPQSPDAGIAYPVPNRFILEQPDGGACNYEPSGDGYTKTGFGNTIYSIACGQRNFRAEVSF